MERIPAARDTLITRFECVLLMVVIVISGCSNPASSPSTVPLSTEILRPASSTASPAVSPGVSTTEASQSGGPLDGGISNGVGNEDSDPPGLDEPDPLLNTVVVTVSDWVRIRSEPRVSDDSIKYEPLLRLGTELLVLGRPVSASGYTWYEVAPVSFVGLEGPGYGWVALAGKDGEPWIALPESHGKIAFMSTQAGNPEIYTVNPDGSGLARLTNSDVGDIAPAWSPDGARIAFGCGIGPETDGGFRTVGPSDICVMDADGRGLVRLMNDPVPDSEPTWSPDGSRIAFGRGEDIYTMNPDGTDIARLTTDDSAFEPAWSPHGTRSGQIYVMNADGTGAVNLTNDLATDDGHPAWSPDGARIAYNSHPSAGGEIAVWLMDPDGSGQVRLPPAPGNDSEPAWSPDGAKIAFTRYGLNLSDIFVSNADGSEAVAVTNLPGFDGSPDWQPLPIARS